jgi:hypothetical protein
MARPPQIDIAHPIRVRVRARRPSAGEKCGMLSLPLRFAVAEAGNVSSRRIKKCIETLPQSVSSRGPVLTSSHKASGLRNGLHSCVFVSRSLKHWSSETVPERSFSSAAAHGPSTSTAFYYSSRYGGCVLPRDLTAALSFDSSYSTCHSYPRYSNDGRGTERVAAESGYQKHIFYCKCPSEFRRTMHRMTSRC